MEQLEAAVTKYCEGVQMDADFKPEVGDLCCCDSPGLSRFIQPNRVNFDSVEEATLK